MLGIDPAKFQNSAGRAVVEHEMALAAHERSRARDDAEVMVAVVASAFRAAGLLAAVDESTYTDGLGSAVHRLTDLILELPAARALTTMTGHGSSGGAPGVGVPALHSLTR